LKGFKNHNEKVVQKISNVHKLLITKQYLNRKKKKSKTSQPESLNNNSKIIILWIMMKYNYNQKINSGGYYDSINIFFFILLLISPPPSAGLGSVSGPSIQLDVVEYVIGIERRARLADGTPIKEYERVDLLENSVPPSKDGTQVNI